MRIIFFSLLLTIPLLTHAQIEGNWYAILDAMGTKLPLSLNVTDGGKAGSLKSPTQSKAAFPFTTASFDGTRFEFTLNDLGVTYNGVLDGKELRGVFNQAQVDFKLTFTRYRPEGFPIGEGPITIIKRPQEPTDFPYRRRAVTFPGGAEGVTIAGELTLPAEKKPKAAVVLVAGSGPQDRNAYLGSQINHSPFLVLSDYLTRRGYAVLRYDERGIGESTGDHSQATTADLAADATAAVAFLRDDKTTKKVPVGMIGHSEGGSITPLVAGQTELDFAILLAAAGLPMDSVSLLQIRKVGESTGMPPRMIDREVAKMRRAYAYIQESQKLDHDQYVEGLYALFERELDNLPAPLRTSITDPRKFNEQYVGPLSLPWVRYAMAFDPAEHLPNLTMPTLALNGTLDTQVPAEDNLNAISIAMARNENEDYTAVPLLNLNHLFQPAETGEVTEYGTIETTFDPTALSVIGDWLDERFN